MAQAGGRLQASRWVTRQALAAAVQHPWQPGTDHTPQGDGFMRTLIQDLIYGARTARRQPGFSFVVVLTLALAIGANTVIFSFANVLLIRPLPLTNADRLGWVFLVDPHTRGDRGLQSIPEFLDYRRLLTSFEAVGASTRGSVTWTGRGDARRLTAHRVTANLIDVWGVRLQAGRTFGPNADAPGAAGEVVLTDHFWERELNRDPAILGQTLMLDNHPATVVGVLAPEMEIGSFTELDVWVPITLRPDAPREERTLRAAGLLRKGSTIPQAHADAVRVAALIAREHPTVNTGWSARVATTRQALTGNETWPLLTLLGLVVGFVLLLACANLANLVLSRASGRRRELALRAALGASRRRVIRQMLTENLIYGVLGGALGLAIAYGGFAVLRAAAYEPFFRMLRIDRNVLLFTSLLAFLTPVLFAMLPALQATRSDVSESLKDGGRTGSGVRGARSRAVLVVAQLSLAVMLVILSTLLVRTLVNLTRAPLGLDVERLLIARLEVPEWRYSTPAAVGEYHEQVLARLRTGGGIERAAFVDRLPILDGEPVTDVEIAGRAAPRPEDRAWGVVAAASDEFFMATGVPVIAGRGFGTEDTPSREPVAIVNREMARRHWGTPEKALDARLTIPGWSSGAPLRVVGVVADVLRGERDGVNPQVFVASRQRSVRRLALVVRSADPLGAAVFVRTQLRALDADVPVFDIRPYRDAIDEDMSSSRVLGGLFSSFSLLALVMAASGLYAVVSYAAAQRVKEFGVRVALGATRFDIARMMLVQTGRLVAIGLVLGLVGGRVLAMGTTTLLYQVSPWDPTTYAGVAIGLGAVALLASYIPVRRATSIDPVAALRLE
jgi:putative ABC transport system permease protein